MNILQLLTQINEKKDKITDSNNGLCFKVSGPSQVLNPFQCRGKDLEKFYSIFRKTGRSGMKIEQWSDLLCLKQKKDRHSFKRKMQS